MQFSDFIVVILLFSLVAVYLDATLCQLLTIVLRLD